MDDCGQDTMGDAPRIHVEVDSLSTTLITRYDGNTLRRVGKSSTTIQIGWRTFVVLVRAKELARRDLVETPT